MRWFGIDGPEVFDVSRCWCVCLLIVQSFHMFVRCVFFCFDVYGPTKPLNTIVPPRIPQHQKPYPPKSNTEPKPSTSTMQSCVQTSQVCTLHGLPINPQRWFLSPRCVRDGSESTTPRCLMFLCVCECVFGIPNRSACVFDVCVFVSMFMLQQSP